VILGSPIGAIPGAILATDADVVLEPNDSGFFIFDVGIHRTTDEARRLQAMIAGHGNKVATGAAVALGLKLPDSTPNNVYGCVVLFMAGHLTALTPDALGHVEVKSVLLPFG
jgi:hypothetical protein